MKKLLSLILTLAMLCSMCVVFGVTASAEGAPSGNFVTFSSAESFTITASKNWDGTLYYSTNGEEASWTEYAGGTALTATQIGEAGDYYLCFRGESNTVVSKNNSWVIDGSNVSCSGSIEKLRDYTGEKPMGNSCYTYMFYGCTALVTAPELPAETLSDYCYEGMFYNCKNLETAPLLPAINLTLNCYKEMFFGCASLVTAPELPATNLADSCYSNMFGRCTALVTAPKLPATILADYCYSSMFYICKNLETAPELPATTLAKSCYYNLFYGCTSLVIPPELPATTLAESCYFQMFYECTSLVTPPELPATTLAESCYFSMFTGCTSLVTPPELPATALAESCYSSMFCRCTEIKLYENASDAGNVSLAWSIPAAANVDGLTNWNTDMFLFSGVSFNGVPEVGKTYYYSMNPEMRNVTGTYQVATIETVYSVEIAWGSMEFTYTDASGTWNPTTLQYENASTAGWDCEADANKITVTNRSNTAVNTAFSFTESITGISCGFYDTATGGNAIAGNTFSLASADPVGEATTGTEQVCTAYIQIISGALISSQTDVKIGTVTVEVN